jgi:RNA polymerase sigma factor (sigma-70 family)
VNADPLDTLLEKLCSGDAAAAERVFLTYEPYLRKVVRRQLTPRLRAKFDSVDVVQSVFADVLQGLRDAAWRFTDATQLRAFLVKTTRNRFIDRYRRHRRELNRDRPLRTADSEQLPVSQQPRPSETAQADDLWAKMLQICPPEHHELLKLKREGRSPQEIVARTGLHDGSIRRILRNLARQLALKERPLPGTSNKYS